MGMDGRTKYRFRKFEKRTNNTTVSSTLQREQRQYRHDDACKTGLMATTKQRQINTNRFC